MAREQALCGTLQSNDCLVRLQRAKGITLEIKSTVYDQFGEQIEAVIRQTLKDLGVEDCELSIEDKGALDCTIKARVETAVRRLNE